MAFWSKKQELAGDSVVNGIPVEMDTAKQPEFREEPEKELDADQLRHRAAHSKKRMAFLGEIASIFMSSPQFQLLSLADFETLVVPAIVNNQFLIVETQSKEKGFVVPVGAALWANVSAEVDQRLSTNLDQPIKLTPNEWKSGDIPWLVAVVGDARVVNPMLQKFVATNLKGLPLKLRARDKDGREAVGMLSVCAS